MHLVRVEWLAGAALLAGCDVLWSIDHVEQARPDAPFLVECNGDDHNEDGDAFPDKCDRCPGIADDQMDGDMDGVGDACDPSGQEKNELVLWEPFETDNDTWNPLNGTWPIKDDALTYASSLSGNAYVLFTGVAPSPPYVIDYHYRIDQIDPQNASLFMVVMDANSADGKGGNCGHYRTTGPLQDVVRITFDQPMTGMESVIMSITPGGYRVRASYDPNGNVTCKLDADDNTTGGATSLTLDTTKPPPGTIGFRSLQVGVSIDYVAIYKIKP